MTQKDSTDAGDRGLARWHRAVAPIALAVLGVVVSLALVISAVNISRPRDAQVPGLDEIVELAKSIVWPVILLFVVSYFSRPLFGFFGRLKRFSIKAGDAEATLEATQANVIGLLGAAEAIASAGGTTQADESVLGAHIATLSVPMPTKVLDSISYVYETINEETIGEFARGTVLWVDDNPQNNAYLIEAFRELGMRVDTAKTTEAALQLLEAPSKYTVIISDMSRPPDDRAGYTLLEKLREQSISTPVIIYAGSNSDVHRQMAFEAGAIESTNSPHHVFELVTRIVSERSSRRASSFPMRGSPNWRQRE